jgi:DNA-binding MarR family transcriptional regulator
MTTTELEVREDLRVAASAHPRSEMSPEATQESSLELSQMRVAAGHACNLMKVLANPDRLMILCQLSQGELRVGELEARLSIVQPTLSQQLTVLREQQLVSTRREGKHIFYSMSSPHALAVIQTLYQQFCQPACAPLGDSTANAMG